MTLTAQSPKLTIPVTVFAAIKGKKNVEERICCALEQEQPLDTLLYLTDVYLTAPQLKRAEEWEKAWRGFVDNPTSARTKKIFASIRNIARNPGELDRLLEHAWWKKMFCEKYPLATLLAATPEARYGLIRKLIQQKNYLLAWTQLVVLLPEEVRSSPPPPPVMRSGVCQLSIVTPAVFERGVRLLVKIVECDKTYQQPLARGLQQGKDAYAMGWDTAVSVLGEKARVDKRQLPNSPRKVAFIKGPRLIEVIFELDRALQEEGWRRYEASGKAKLTRSVADINAENTGEDGVNHVIISRILNRIAPKHGGRGHY